MAEDRSSTESAAASVLFAVCAAVRETLLNAPSAAVPVFSNASRARSPLCVISLNLEEISSMALNTTFSVAMSVLLSPYRDELHGVPSARARAFLLLGGDVKELLSPAHSVELLRSETVPLPKYMGPVRLAARAANQFFASSISFSSACFCSSSESWPPMPSRAMTTRVT